MNENYPRIRNLQSLNEVDMLLDYLLDILGIKCLDENLDEHLRKFKFIYEFIISKFGFLTIPEIKEAFKMYVAKDFGHKDIFRTLDTIIVYDVLNCFVGFRADSLRTYNEKKNILLIEQSNSLSESEKKQIMVDAVNNKFIEYIENKNISEPIEHIFKELVERKIIKMPTAETPKISIYYDRKLLEAKIQVERELKAVVSISKKDTIKIKEELDKIISNNSVKVEIRAKKLVLEDFFDKQIELKKEIIL